MAKKALTLLLALLAAALFAPAALAAEAEADPEPTAYYQLGDSWEYTLTHEVEVANVARSYAFAITVSIPLIDETMPLYNELVGTELNPYPDEIVTDAAGHRYAVYHIDSLEGYHALTFTQRYALRVSTIKYPHFDRAAVADTYSDVEQRLLVSALAPANDVQSTDSEIIDFAEKAVAAAGAANPYQIASALFAAVNQALDYSNGLDGDGAEEPQDALRTLRRGTANCEGYTNLYMACLRSQGVACRRVNGYLYQPEKHSGPGYLDVENKRLLANSLRHTWVEYYLPGIGWIIADPTFTYVFQVNGKPEKFVKWDLFSEIAPAQRYLATRTGDMGGERIDVDFTGGNIDTTFTASLVTGLVYSPFSDITGHWAQDAVTFCVQNKLFQGVSAASFAPEQTMTRAMFVTALGRLYQSVGGEIRSYNPSVLQFTDVDYHDYYIDYLGWAVDAQLIEGYGDSLFGPNDSVTREQMGKMITDFMTLMEQPLAADAELAFADLSQISEWALDGIRACSQNGVITGYPDNTFRPAHAATRAQVAAIIERVSRLLNGETLVVPEPAPPADTTDTTDAAAGETAPEAPAQDDTQDDAHDDTQDDKQDATPDGTPDDTI